MYLLRNQTGLNATGEGITNYGHPLTFEEIGAEFKGIPERTIRKWAARLRREGYVRTENHSNRGLIFWIAKAKPKTRKVKITAEEAGFMFAAAERVRQNSRPSRDARSKNSRPRWDASSTDSRPDMDASSIEETSQQFAAIAVGGACETPTPKGSTSENLSYYNTASAARTAASPDCSFQETLKKLQPHYQREGLSQREVWDREKLLAEQKETILSKYPPKDAPGKVTVTRKEATA